MAGSFNLYQLFSGEYVELDEKEQTVEFWQRAASYLEQVVVQIESIDEGALSMQDRHQLVQSVSQQMRWLASFPVAGSAPEQEVGSPRSEREAVLALARKAGQQAGSLSKRYDVQKGLQVKPPKKRIPG